jgi:hypothetical protein
MLLVGEELRQGGLPVAARDNQTYPIARVEVCGLYIIFRASGSTCFKKRILIIEDNE